MNHRIGLLLLTLLLSTSVASAQIVVNGDFEGGTYSVGNDTIPTGWTAFETFSGSLAEISTIDVLNGNGPSQAGAWCLDTSRSLGGLSGDWTSIEQEMSECVHTASSLDLDLDVRVMSHDLHAGGNFSFEWPVNVVIFYTDTAGASRSWLWGFYLASPGTGGNGSPNETLVPNGAWTSHTFDLLAELTNPARLDVIRVGGSGWNFHGQIDNVRITASAPPPLFPGTSDDVRLRHSINGGAFLCDGLVNVNVGDLITLHADTPGGTFIGSEMLIAGEILPIGVVLPQPFPGIALSGGPTTVLIAGGIVNGPGSTIVYGNQGYYLSYHWPISMTGLSFTTQAFALSINALNSIFGTSDGQRLQ